MTSNWSFGSQVPSGERAPAPAPPPALLQGARGVYRLLEQLGAGGGGQVYRALDPDGREVAIKLLLPSGSPEHATRLEREGEMAAALEHPNVVQLRELGTHDGRPFLVYELVQGGGEFREVLRELLLVERLDLLAQVIDGVAAAHQRGLIHRDLKPENVLLGADGRPRISDFGLGLREQDRRLTQTGALVGTPRAMAPEQIRGRREEQGPATDVWSLGVMLYEALTGTPPFDGDSLAQLAVQVSTAEPVPPRKRDPSVPAALEAVCLKALAKAPADRYSDAGELGRALRAARAPRRAPRRAPWVLAALALAAVGLGVGVALRSPAGPDPARDGASALEAELAAIEAIYETKDYATSLERVRAFQERHPTNLEARLMEGEIYAQTERYADAVAAFGRALALDPDNVRALTGGGACKARLGRITEGLADLDRAIALEPQHADAYEKRSIVQYERGSYRAALEDAERALAIKAESSEGLNFRGLARGALGDLAGAIQDFQAAYDMTKDPRILANLGTARFEHGQREQALADLRQALRERPEHYPAWITLAIDDVRRRRWAEALTKFERALTYAPNDPSGRFGRALCFHRMKRYAEARREAEWLIANHPDHDQAQQARAMLESMRRKGR